MGNRTRVKRRLFYGSLISYESKAVFHLLAAELTGLVDVITFVESNVTHRGTARPWKYTDESADGAARRAELARLFPGVSVVFDRYVEWPVIRVHNGMGRDLASRDIIPSLWAREGMQPHDVGIMADTDEMFSRSFMRAMRVCDVPQFRSRRHPGAVDAGCTAAKISAASLVFEGALDCKWKSRRWHHPDAILGECIEGIGTRPPHTNQSHPISAKYGVPLFGGVRYAGGWKAFKHLAGLWSGADLKMRAVGPLPPAFSRRTQRSNAFHFHNFFSSPDQLRNKYFSYAHYDKNGRAKSASNFSLADTDGKGRMHPDVDVALRCISGAPDGRRDDELYQSGGWVSSRQVGVPKWVKQHSTELANMWAGVLISNPLVRTKAGLGTLDPHGSGRR